MNLRKKIEEINLEDLLSEGDCATESYVDYENREILIEGVIDNEAIRNYVMPIIQINKDDDDRDIPIKDRLPITLYIACYGGDAIAGGSLIDVIRASKTPIKGVVFHAYSMGFLIALACHSKYCYKSSSYLIHDGGLNLVNSSGKVKDMYEFFAVKNDKMIQDFILENTKITKKQLTKNWRRDWYLTADEALELGIVDKIVNDIV